MSTDVTSMSTDKNKVIVQRFFEEIFSKGNRATADELLATDFAFYGPPGGIHGPENFLQFTNSIRDALDVHFTVDVVIADGGKVSSLCTMHGTHRKEFREIPARGKKFALPRIDNFRILEDGKIQEVRTTFDHPTLLQILRTPEGQ